MPDCEESQSPCLAEHSVVQETKTLVNVGQYPSICVDIEAVNKLKIQIEKDFNLFSHHHQQQNIETYMLERCGLLVYPQLNVCSTVPQNFIVCISPVISQPWKNIFYYILRYKKINARDKCAKKWEHACEPNLIYIAQIFLPTLRPQLIIGV